MNKALLMTLLLTITLQQTVLLRSDVSTTFIKSPANHVTVIEAYHTKHNLNYIGYAADWIYKNGLDSWPAGDRTTFEADFWAECQRDAVLIITADNSFTATLNGGTALRGNDWRKKYRFTLKNIKCGLNKLVVSTVNADKNTPAALIFAITQDQSKCYQCASPLSYYNRDSCRCECIDRCNCSSVNKLYAWHGYPTCGCKCKLINFCGDIQYFNARTCSCRCKKIACLPGYYQNSSTCRCTKRT